MTRIQGGRLFHARTLRNSSYQLWNRKSVMSPFMKNYQANGPSTGILSWTQATGSSRKFRITRIVRNLHRYSENRTYEATYTPHSTSRSKIISPQARSAHGRSTVLHLGLFQESPNGSSGNLMNKFATYPIYSVHQYNLSKNCACCRTILTKHTRGTRWT